MTKSRSVADHGALLVGQWFGTGLSPVGPGTVGSLGALPVFFLLRENPLPYWLTTFFVCLVGIPISNRCARILGEKDPSSVVIDEVAGVLLAMGTVAQASWYVLLLAWVLFRVLDITKPWLIDRAQFLHPPGLGIMADDLLAGTATGAIVFAVDHVLTRY